MPNRGEVWLADLNPRRGTEPGKTRPVLVVQSQALLDAGHPSTLVVPLTTKLVDDAAPLRILIPAADRLQSDSDLLVDQLRAIDNRRLIKGPLVRLDELLMATAGAAILEVLDLAADPPAADDAEALGRGSPDPTP
ncbi:MAG: type II toxin-antitoxin system PemK/MazF family toxin [Gemmatimonadetes bacterium]|nr:type II toxin-antitoxin system PemK/MazF family toxin [Gemmatimonadota bacterium]